MSPEYGATCGFFPVDQMTLDYLRADRPQRRAASRSSRRTARRTCSGTTRRSTATYSQVVELDLGDVEPSLAGPRRPQDRVPLSRGEAARSSRRSARSASTTANGSHDRAVADTFPASDPTTEQQPAGERDARRRGRSRRPPRPKHACRRASRRRRRLRARPRLRRDRGDHVVHEHVEPAGDDRRRAARARRRSSAASTRKPWVKSSLAPGSKVVTRYYEQAGLQELPRRSSASTRSATAARRASATRGRSPTRSRAAIAEGDLVVCSVLSGNRNFEARIHPEVKANYLASPPLVVAYALAGRMDIDFETEPLGTAHDGDDVYLRDLWPSAREISETIASSVRAEQFAETYADVFTGDDDLARAAGAGGRALRVGARLDLRAPAAVLRGDVARARRRRRRRGRALPRLARRLGDDRPHLARRLDQARLAGRAPTSSSTASSARTSTRTARGAATTR